MYQVLNNFYCISIETRKNGGRAMKKRNYFVSIILISVIALTGCGKNEQMAELQQKYDTISKHYTKLVADYDKLKISYNGLQQECENIKNLPDMVVSLVDGAEVWELTLHSSLEESQKNCEKYPYRSGSYNITITCNNGEKISNIYWCYDGGMVSIMDMVHNVDNTYIFQIATNHKYMNSFIIECEGKNDVYTSFYGVE